MQVLLYSAPLSLHKCAAGQRISWNHGWDYSPTSSSCYITDLSAALFSGLGPHKSSHSLNTHDFLANLSILSRPSLPFRPLGIMPSYTFSSLSQTLDNTLASLPWSGERNDRKEQPSAPRLSRKRDLLLAFVMVSLPLLVIAILLLCFIFLSDRERPATYREIQALPFFEYPSSDAFYTSVDPGNFLLVGSWASNIAEIVVAPFMVLFSYAVAREILQHAASGHGDPESRPPLLREIMRGAHVGVWHWASEKFFRRSKAAPGKRPVLRVVDVAGLGLFTATLLT